MNDAMNRPSDEAPLRETDEPNEGAAIDRRALLAGSGALVVGVCGFRAMRHVLRKPSPVFVAGNQRYDGPLEQTIRDGLESVGIGPKTIRNRRVLLKPNLVEPDRLSPHMTTHPAVVLAAADVFRSWGAHVLIGEGPGHVRDMDLASYNAGFEEPLRDARLSLIDLNFDQPHRVRNRGRRSKLRSFWFPRTVTDCDLIVSLPKLKTHHWVGMTASMKNLYGTLPGIKYGWPKNVLHHAGIPQTVVDINASLPKTIAIIDGILGMEGDGPIMGTPKPLGILAVGANLPALDATCARIMRLHPERIPYLRLADGWLGPIDDSQIVQRGDQWQRLATPFDVLDVPHLHGLVDRTSLASV